MPVSSRTAFNCACQSGWLLCSAVHLGEGWAVGGGWWGPSRKASLRKACLQRRRLSTRGAARWVAMVARKIHGVAKLQATEEEGGGGAEGGAMHPQIVAVTFSQAKCCMSTPYRRLPKLVQLLFCFGIDVDADCRWARWCKWVSKCARTGENSEHDEHMITVNETLLSK